MFLFTHIEKCAGTSFKSALKLTFFRYVHVSKNLHGGNHLKNDLKGNQFKEIKKLLPTGIGGHNVRPYLEFLNLDNHFTITFLRNPIERYMSHYNHIKGTRHIRDFDHFLTSDYVKNFMVNKLTGEGANNLEMAKKLIDQYSFVGDSNRYNQSLNHLSKLMGKRFFSSAEFKNVRKSNSDYLKYEDLSTIQKNKVIEQNDLDIQLYKYFLSKSSFLDEYPSRYEYRKPSKLRVKLFDKMNRFKKKKINKIRTQIN
jgi:hypothetical protein